MKLIIDNIDFSNFLTKYGYGISYKKILGANSFVTLDGVKHEDILAWKSTVTAEIKPVTSSQLSTLVTSCNKELVLVTYFDTKKNGYVSKKMIPQLSQASIALAKLSVTYWNGGSSGIVLTLEEQ